MDSAGVPNCWHKAHRHKPTIGTKPNHRLDYESPLSTDYQSPGLQYNLVYRQTDIVGTAPSLWSSSSIKPNIIAPAIIVADPRKHKPPPKTTLATLSRTVDESGPFRTIVGLVQDCLGAFPAKVLTKLPLVHASDA